MKKLFLALLLLAAGLCHATTTVTGTLQNLGTGTVSNSYVRFWLRGCKGGQPRIGGTAIIAPSQGGVFFFDLPSNSSGVVSGTLYSTRDAAGTGNGEIECNASKTSEWYGMQAFYKGQGGPEVAVHAQIGVTMDISNVIPIVTPPMSTAGNQPLGPGGRFVTSNLAPPTPLQCAIWLSDSTLGNLPCASSGTLATVYPFSLPGTATQGALGLLYPSSGQRNFSMWNGANWFNISPFDSDARAWACDNTGATDASPCLDTMLKAISTSSGQSVRIPAGTYLINSPLHVTRESNISCDGGQYDHPPTTLKLGPGANITFDSASASSDGGRAAWSTFRGCKVLGTVAGCTASSGSGVLSSCNINPSSALGLSANDYLVVMGLNGTSYWGLTVPQGTQVASTTSNSITLAGGVLSSFSGAVTVMKAGYVATTGTTTNSSTTISSVATPTAFHPGDPILGPGISYGTIVTATNSGAGTITINPAAGAGAGAGSLTKGPLANVVLHVGSVVAEDLAIDNCAGYCFDVQGSVNFSPAIIADGQYINRLRVTRAGDACVHYKGADANTSTDIGIQATYCANGNIIDDSFLGNTHIGAQVANTTGSAYKGVGVNANNLWLNSYMEAGSKAVSASGTNLFICGINQTNFNNTNNGNFIGCDGHISPTFFWRNDQSGSTASSINGSPSLTGVTSISQWHVGDTIVGACIAATTLISATDGVSVLTMNKNATCTADLMPITQTRTIGYNGTNTSSGSELFGFGYSTNGSTEFDYLFGYVDPAYKASTTELGTFQWQYRAAANALNFTTDASQAAWDFPGSGNNYGYPVFPKGMTVGALANKVDIRASASASAPTSGLWHNGGLAISTTTGLFQQRNAGKSTTGAADTTSGSATIANQDANFLGRCAPGDSVTGTGIANATVLVDQSTLSRAATASNAGVTFTCKRLPKAHVATTCDTHTNTTVDNCSTVSGWAVNDTIQGTGFATGTFITAIVGTTFTVSKATTATAAGVAVSDATFVQFVDTTATSPVAKFTATLSPASVAANTCAEQTFTVTGVVVGDVVSVNKPTAQAGLGLAGVRASASNQVGINFCNTTASPIVPTASESYSVGVIH